MVEEITYNPNTVKLYLELLRNCLTRTIFPDEDYIPALTPTLVPFDPEARRYGRRWPTEALTMVGSERLSSLEQLCLAAIHQNIRGDFVECGVWRGGCSILMRGVLVALEDKVRRVWLFDSFEGLPKPTLPQDRDDRLWEIDHLRVTLESVQTNFRTFGLLDEHVLFQKGWFKDTLPVAKVDHIAVLRLDGDMYESTIIALNSLYAKVSPGGWVIVDDYGAIEACRQAVNDFRNEHRIDSPIEMVDWTGAHWRKEI